MSRSRAPFVITLVLSAWTASATAQQSSIRPDSARAQIHTSLRAFYFNLAHQDWEALTADILAAKVVAHRPAPEAMVLAASGASSPVDGPAACSSNRALVDRAIITLDGNWAEVSVPRCSAALAGADQFRLIHFEERWRFVYIDLYEEPVKVTLHPRSPPPVKRR
jgi:hypothetical protein